MHGTMCMGMIMVHINLMSKMMAATTAGCIHSRGEMCIFCLVAKNEGPISYLHAYMFPAKRVHLAMLFGTKINHQNFI